MRRNKGIPKFVEERDPTPLGDTVVSLGIMIAYYRVDSCMKGNLKCICKLMVCRNNHFDW